ncbi:MAG TPA: GntG family PLP-dependent aldolase [Fimbriimonas sp.]
MHLPSFAADQRDLVDLRSDTVTRPTPEMFEAMMSMPVGDDVLGDDPTVQELERLAADLMGKESGLFVPSGTMGNQIAIASHCKPGEAMIIEEEAHMLYYEVGGPALLAGVVSWTLPSRRGAMDPSQIERRFVKASIHTPGTTLLCLENTHNRAGGSIIPQPLMSEYRHVADRTGMKVHLDGARIFNASVAQRIPAKEIAQHVDSVNFCLSKGLRSPVGSVLCGPADFIERGRIWRKRLGGGMRQSGILAACGIVSLTKMVDRLAEDHARAMRTAEALADVPGLCVEPETVETNMVLVPTEKPAVDIQQKLAQQGVLCLPVAANRLRLVFHADVDDAKTDRAIEAFRKLAH